MNQDAILKDPRLYWQQVNRGYLEKNVATKKLYLASVFVDLEAHFSSFPRLYVNVHYKMSGHHFVVGDFFLIFWLLRPK